MIKLSLCIPCYNVEKYISDCLDSIIKQDFKDYEIICVDDCSEDNTWNILKAYSEKNNKIKIFRHLKNEKSVWTRKTAVSMAKGQYLLFIDGDDFLPQNSLQKVWDLVDSSHADVVEFCCEQVDIRGNLINNSADYCIIHEGILQGNDIFNAVSENRIGQMLWNKAYRTSLLKDIYLRCGVRNLYYKDDVYLACLFYRNAEKYFGVKDRLYCYRLNSGNSRQTVMTISIFEDRCKCSQICLDWMYCFFESNQLQQQEIKLIKSKINVWCKRNNLNDLMNSANEENLEEFIDVFLNAWGSYSLIEFYNLCMDEKIKDILLYQIRILLDALEIISTKFNRRSIYSNNHFQIIKNLFIHESKYDLNKILLSWDKNV